MAEFNPKITPELFSIIRDEFRTLPQDWTKTRRAQDLQSNHPEFSLSTLEVYAGILADAAPSVVDAYIEGRISMVCLSEIYSMNRGTQEILLPDIISKKLTPSSLRMIRNLVKEGLPLSSAIGRAVGEIPRDEPRRGDKPKNIDSLMDEISKAGSRFRAMVAMVMDLLDTAERAEGIHLDLFEKVYLLRHLVGEQYEFIDQKVRRYITTIKKRIEARTGLSPLPELDRPEGGPDGHNTEAGEASDRAEKRDDLEDGPAVPDQPRQGQGQKR